MSKLYLCVAGLLAILPFVSDAACAESPSNQMNATLVRIASSPQGEYEPQWSPDGKKIAFQSDWGGSMDVWVVDVPRTARP